MWPFRCRRPCCHCWCWSWCCCCCLIGPGVFADPTAAGAAASAAAAAAATLGKPSHTKGAHSTMPCPPATRDSCSRARRAAQRDVAAATAAAAAAAPSRAVPDSILSSPLAQGRPPLVLVPLAPQRLALALIHALVLLLPPLELSIPFPRPRLHGWRHGVRPAPCQERCNLRAAAGACVAPRGRGRCGLKAPAARETPHMSIHRAAAAASTDVGSCSTGKPPNPVVRTASQAGWSLARAH